MLSFLHRWHYCWKCEFNTDVNYYHCVGEHLSFYKKVHIKTRHTKKVAPGTQDSESGTYTWDPRPGTIHLGLCSWDLGSGADRQNLYVGPRTWNPLPRILHLGPGISDPLCGNPDPIPMHSTQEPYLGALTLMQLSHNVQFSRVA